MRRISPQELEELFLDTLTRGSSSTLEQDDEGIAYDIFEEFDTGVISFLHEDSLNRLLLHCLIDERIKNLSLLLREKAMVLLENKRALSAVKRDPEWRDVFHLSDQIIALKSEFDQRPKSISRRLSLFWKRYVSIVHRLTSAPPIESIGISSRYKNQRDSTSKADGFECREVQCSPAYVENQLRRAGAQK